MGGRRFRCGERDWRGGVPVLDVNWGGGSYTRRSASEVVVVVGVVELGASSKLGVRLGGLGWFEVDCGETAGNLFVLRDSAVQRTAGPDTPVHSWQGYVCRINARQSRVSTVDLLELQRVVKASKTLCAVA